MFPTKITPVIEKIRILEVPVETRLKGGADQDERMAIMTLATNPGFLALVRRFRFAGEALKNKLNFERQASMDDVAFLQAGIYWCRWLDNEINREVLKTKRVVVDAEAEEVEAFRKIDAQLERIGMEDGQ
jgi:hypothetical protein